ncbi:cutinase family protein [Mycobacterium shimoidei]|uniref:Putative cutinase n=1 Tax=Mycobacterium shimoidei TaxID=29313 RepID=A0A375YWP9_MYCSH|nr:cutinase family protein [Mycobacterium shimoidei]MCV7259604.1 cutinase family protein [Mycobacterium shimoidei]SRX93130.1 putative cutinase [Mycobacterium shimoidei]
MTARNIVRKFFVAVTALAALCGVASYVPAATAEPCPDAEVVFARGTGEPPGVGGTGQAFVDSLSAQVPGRSVGVYPVNYPASTDYYNSAMDGAGDARAHVQNMVATCPNTKMVLGGYSQGASVMDLASNEMPSQVADHVAAVALFGTPSTNYAQQMAGRPFPALNPGYQPKSIDLCLPDDIVCADNGSMIAHLQYVPEMTNQAATFAAGRL